jgi:hypothetical protein
MIVHVMNVKPKQKVVGYGLDYAEQYRSVSFIGILELLEDETPSPSPVTHSKKVQQLSGKKRQNETSTSNNTEESTSSKSNSKKQKKLK